MAPAIHLTLLTLLITTVTVAAYTNHTVADKAGWIFDPNTNKSSADYTKWAANKTFELGDYLIFNSNTNQTVVLTYNETTFKSCSMDNSSDSDTFFYGKGNEFNQPLIVEVPLTIEGPNYFFSSASDGIQCQNGMAFGIKVSHGVGLPEYLNQPPPPPYVDPPESGDGEVTPPGAGLGGGAGANVRWTVGCAVTCFGIFALFF